MWDSKLIPELKELGLLSWERLLIGRVPQEIALKFVWKNIVNISEEVFEVPDMSGDPQDKAHEGSPQTTSTPVAEIVILINVPHPINGNNLEKLP